MQAGRKVLKLEGKRFRFGFHTLIFVHIPKCGGTSLHRTLENIQGLQYRHLRGIPEDLEGIESLDGIGGHQNFGSTPLHKSRSRLVYITVIRSPVERVLSFYRHILDHPNHHLRRAHPDLKDASPTQFVERLAAEGNYEISNLQTKMLTGNARLSVDAAIDHISKHYSIIGLLEETKSYLDPLRVLFPNGPIAPNTLNVSTPREVDTLRTPQFEALVQELNDKDHAIYEHFAQLQHRSA